MCNDLELYALDALPEEERNTFESHLQDCYACKNELPELHDTTALLALSAPAVKPPARLKMKVLAIPGQEQVNKSIETAPVEITEKKPFYRTRKFTLQVLAALLSLTAAFSLGYSITQVTSPTVSYETPASPMETLLAANDASVVNKKVGESGSISIIYSDDLNKAVFGAKSLAPLEGNEVYQVWYQNRGGSLIPVGSFTNTDESITVLTGDLKNAKAVGLTKEPEPDATAPSAAPLMFINL